MQPVIGLIAITISFASSVLLTALVRLLARRFGIVAKPKADRWHSRPTALLGGVAIAVSTLITCFFFVPLTTQSVTVLIGSFLMFLLGLVDDLVNLKPYQKVIGQLIAASIIVSANLILPWTGYFPVNVLITLFWLVGITNAINLLDNMDGLAAGVSAVAAFFLSLQFMLHDPSGMNYAWMTLFFAATLIGFLVFNHNPATIFMGDCGSLFIGFFLASSALLTNQAGRSRSFLPVIAVPVLVLLIPIFDTTLVFILRKLAGRSIAQGGRDHTSHRLVALGLSERHAAWMLWTLAGISGFMGLSIQQLPLEASLVCVFLFSLALIYLGIHLGKVKVYEVSQPAPVLGFLVDISYKRRIFEVLLDCSLIIFAYYLSYVIVFGPLESSKDPVPFFQSLPLVVGLKIASLTAAGVYRGLWRYISTELLWVYLRGVLIGSMASVVVLTFVFRFQGFSRVMFVLDGFILFFLIAGSRFGFRLFRGFFQASRITDKIKKVLIYGAGDGGEILVREITNNPEWQLKPVGFLDDDPNKHGRILRGLRVFGDLENIQDICVKTGASQIIISSIRFSGQRVKQISSYCEKNGLDLFKLSLNIEPIYHHDFDEPDETPQIISSYSVDDSSSRIIQDNADLTD